MEKKQLLFKTIFDALEIPRSNYDDLFGAVEMIFGTNDPEQYYKIWYVLAGYGSLHIGSEKLPHFKSDGYVALANFNEKWEDYQTQLEDLLSVRFEDDEVSEMISEFEEVYLNEEDEMDYLLDDTSCMLEEKGYNVIRIDTKSDECIFTIVKDDVFKVFKDAFIELFEDTDFETILY